jgi:DNA-binding GntR family transcriptional regulator
VAARGSDDRSRLLVTAWLNQHSSEIEEAMRVRAMVEGQAILDIPDADLATLLRDVRAVIADQRTAIEGEDFLRAAQANQDFHLLLTSRTPNRLLRTLAVGLIDYSRRAAVAIYSDKEGALESLAEHDAIADAIGRGDRAEAARLNGEHQLQPLWRRAGHEDDAAPPSANGAGTAHAVAPAGS